MKKIVLILTIILLAKPVLYSRGLSDTSSVEKTGWLVYYLGHVIWFESSVTTEIKDKSFFTPGRKYQNGLIVDYRIEAIQFKLFSKCYSIRSLTNIDTVTKEGQYIYKESLCILPVKVKVKIRTGDSEQYDFAGVSFKRKNDESTIEYWFNTNYYVREVELLRKKDKRKFSHYLKKHNLTMDKIIQGQKGAW